MPTVIPSSTLVTACWPVREAKQRRASAADSTGHIFVAGSTSSQGFPLRSPVQEAFSLASGFLTELDQSANLLFSTYVGNTSLFSGQRAGARSGW